MQIHFNYLTIKINLSKKIVIKDQKVRLEKSTITYEETRPRNDTSFQSMNEEDLLAMLKETKSVHDEADILHYLLEIKYEL